ncbi:hypothetical protein I551_4247 [Mycobacterium ulcerans str. Harvey]|uniref:Uncharacterized protein n=1 Tax=Mycobacterium ulcerans str. Harvey TaxID=1299332 RepID=A0ABN0QX93_MYCUL|nr:hypothetical protein I551_4247 [Mycobacterium ulcerans str. Harvey]
MIAAAVATHSLQICTPAPATSMSISVSGFAQNEHQICATGVG